MGLTQILSIHKQTDDVSFDVPLQVINDELAAGAMEDYFTAGDGPSGSNLFLHLATAADAAAGHGVIEGRLTLVNEYEGPEPSTEVETWGQFDLEAAQVVANHLVAGTLIFHEDVEGNESNWYKLTPGKAEDVEPTF